MLEIEIDNTLIPVKVNGKIIVTEMPYFCVYFSQTGDIFKASLSLSDLSDDGNRLDGFLSRYIGNATFEDKELKGSAEFQNYFLPNGEKIKSSWYYDEGHFAVSFKDMRNDYSIEPTGEELAFIKRVLNTDDENACQLFDLDRLISDLLAIIETQLIKSINE